MQKAKKKKYISAIENRKQLLMPEYDFLCCRMLADIVGV